MTDRTVSRLLGAALVGALVLASGQRRVGAAGTITGVVFEDFNGNGTRDTTTTVPNAGGPSGVTSTAIDRGVAGIAVTVYDSVGTVRGNATTDSVGAYSIAATGIGPYRVEFTSLPAGYHPSAFAGGATGNGSTVQFVPDGNSGNVNLGILDPASFCQNNPTIYTSCFVFDEQVSGPNNALPVLIDFPYTAGANTVTPADFFQPSGHNLMVPANGVGTVFGLAHRRATNTIYAAAFMKRHAGYGPNGPGAIYAVDPATLPGGAPTLFADLDAIYGAGTTGGDAHAGNGGDFDRDNGDIAWDAVGKTSLGGLEASPDGQFVFVVSLFDRRIYRLPTTLPLIPANIQSVAIPVPASALPSNGADLRPFALQYHQGVLYVGMVNSAESTASQANLRGYVYTLNPSTMTFGSAPAFEFPLNYPRGYVQNFSGTTSAVWNPWTTSFTLAPGGGAAVGSYPQPLLSGLAFDVDGNLTIGVRDRSGDQFGFYTFDNPANGTRYEGVAGGDTLFAQITTPGNLASGWTLESNAATTRFGPTAGAGNNQGPGNGEYYFADGYYTGGTHQELSGGAVLQLPGFPDVVSSAFDPGRTVRTGGFIWLRESTGARSKGYDVYDTGFPFPQVPQSSFSKANGFGEMVVICQAAPIEIGNRVWDDVDADGVQDPGEAGLDGVSVQLIAPGGGVLATVVTANGGQYYFSSGAGTNAGNAAYAVAGLTVSTPNYRIRIAAAQGALGGRALTLGNNDPSPNGDSRDSDGVTAGANAEVVFNTGAAGFNDHTYDVGFTNTPLPILSLGNFVWYDTNDNGAVDAGEQPIGSVDVVLYRDNGNGLFDATVDTLVSTQATSSGGSYLFTGLTPGNYFVQVPASEFGAGQPLNGYQNSSGQTAGDTNNVDHGAAAPVLGQGIVSDLVTMTVGGEPINDGDTDPDTNLTIDFGFYKLTLGNLVFNDADNSGTFNAGDTPRAGVTVDLMDATGTTVLATTVTDASGLYMFMGLTPGDYRVRITPPAGFTSSTGGGSEPGVDPDNNFDNDDNGTNAGGFIISAPITLTPGGEPTVTNAVGETQNMTLDFGLIPPPGLSLGNFVWRDTNNDGVVSAGETGLDGATVRLLNASGTTVLATQVTAGGGFYLFTGLAAGDYVVEVVTPAGFVSSSGGGTEPASDPDNDINSDDNGTTLGAVVRSLPVTLSIGGEPTNDGDTDPNSNLTVDFGFVPQGVLSLGNLVWLDLNNNGIVDPGEPGLAGVTMRLIAADLVTVLGTTTTNASGLYLFSGLAPGTYLVEVDRTSGAVTGYASSTDIVTSADPNNDINNDDNGVVVTAATVRSGPVVLTVLGEPINDGDTDPNSNLSVDFGFVRALSLGNFVWADVNNNGRVDPGETGIAGVTVRLIASDGVTVLATTTTDATGRYLFGGLLPGSYYVEVVPPPGAQSSTDIPSSANPDNDTDNDDNGVNLNGGVVRSGLVTLTLGGEPINDGDTSPDSNLTVDFGFVPAFGGGGSADICLLQTIPSSVAPGGQMSITYTAVNRGPGVATDVMIEGMIPTGTTLVSATPSAGGVCAVVSGMLDCRWPGLTASGPAGNRTVTVVFQVGAGVPGGSVIWSWFMAGASSPEPYPSNNMVDSYVFVVDSAATPVDLAIVGTVQAGSQSGAAVAARVGQPATVRFTVTNTGLAPGRGQYVVLLDEVGVLEITGAAYSQGVAGVSNATSGTWETGLIAPGGTATLQLTVVPRTGAAGKLQAVRIDGAPADPNAANDNAEVAIDAIGPGGERFVAAGNVDGVAGGELVAGAGAGETTQVRVFTGAGAPWHTFFAFDRAFRGGVRVAACDVNADGIDELIAAQGPGGGRVRVLSLAGGLVTELVAFDAFEAGFTGGLNVACSDLDGDGRAEVVVGPEGGRAPDVKVFTVGALSAVATAQFQAYEPTFTGGVRIAAARFSGSGLVGAFNVATMPGAGRGTELRVWSVSGVSVTNVGAAALFGSTSGARVVLGDVNGDSGLDLLLMPDAGTPTLLQAFSLSTGALVINAPPGTGGYTSLHAAIGMLSGGPGAPELIVGSGPGMVPTLGTFVVTPSGVAYQRLGFTALEQP